MKTIYILMTMLVVNYSATAQTSPIHSSLKFREIHALYSNGKVNDTTYLKKIDSLTTDLLNKGILYSVNKMVENLNLYYQIAWNDHSLSSYRINYYLMLLNNAYMSDFRGASIYYAEKVKEEAEKYGKPRPIIELSVKTQIYSLQKRYDKTIEIYQKEKKYFTELLHKVKDNPENYHYEGLDALKLLDNVFNAYAAQNDTVNIERIYQLEKKFIEALHTRSSVSENDKALINFSSLTIDFYKHSFYGAYDKALEVLNKLEHLLKHNNGSLGYIEYSLLEWKTSLFLEMKNIDSTSYYLKKYSEIPVFSQNQKTLIYNYWAKLETLRGDHIEANKWLLKALEESEKVKQDLSVEMDDLLYAQTQAEQSKLALERTEREKRVRTKWMISLIMLSVIIISAIYVFMRKKYIKSKKLIKALNDAADLQISIMEDFEMEVRKEEQKRLSQNLHDDLSGTLAAIKNRAELVLLNSTDEKQKVYIQRLYELITEVFDKVRNKSHHLFQSAHFVSEEMFKQHIINLAEIAFPTSNYKVDIQIDDFAMANISLEVRSQLIRVIQEAFTNILKHAKATSIEVSVCREKDLLLILIKDDGIGIKKVNEKTLGINNMHERLRAFNGVVKVEGDDLGVEIIITLPVPVNVQF
ncbi:MAG: histidine kinase [Myroides sp.]|nr:histidine kinase [Myroides sp.]